MMIVCMINVVVERNVYCSGIEIHVWPSCLPMPSVCQESILTGMIYPLSFKGCGFESYGVLRVGGLGLRV